MTALENLALILDIDGVIRDVAGSYRRALSDTVAHFTQAQYRPSAREIDRLKEEGIWNNDWEAAQEMIRRFYTDPDRESPEDILEVSYETIVTFFQSRYRGTNWDGYIIHEPLLVTPAFFRALQEAGIAWGFFSGATRASASYVLNRLGLENPVLVAMEDAPGKPDPCGLFTVANLLSRKNVVYAGDTVADMLTIVSARQQDSARNYTAIGVLPPHVLNTDPAAYSLVLEEKGADRVVTSITELTPAFLQEFVIL